MSLTVLFAPAARPGLGGGHVMRCLSLAAALEKAGARCIFAVSELGWRIVERFASSPVELDLLKDGRLADRVASWRPDVLVLDDYGIGAEQEGAVKAHVRVLVVLDDLADRPHAADILLDPGYGRTLDDYAGLVPDGATVLLGPGYALLRPEFAALRSAGLKPVTPEVEHVFVSFGLSDVEMVTARTVIALRAKAPHARFDVALGSDAPSVAELAPLAEDDPGLKLHVDAREVAPLMQAADVAVGAGGSATWERCCLGVPTLAVVVAENQRELIRRLDEEGVVVGLDLADPHFNRALGDAFVRLSDYDLRIRLRERSTALCDGEGAERAAEAIITRFSRS